MFGVSNSIRHLLGLWELGLHIKRLAKFVSSLFSMLIRCYIIPGKKNMVALPQVAPQVIHMVQWFVDSSAPPARCNGGNPGPMLIQKSTCHCRVHYRLSYRDH